VRVCRTKREFIIPWGMLPQGILLLLPLFGVHSLFSCIPHPFVCLQVGVCYLCRAFSGVVGVVECLSDALPF
jgi:hypothetical protein